MKPHQIPADRPWLLRVQAMYMDVGLRMDAAGGNTTAQDRLGRILKVRERLMLRYDVRDAIRAATNDGNVVKGRYVTVRGQGGGVWNGSRFTDKARRTACVRIFTQGRVQEQVWRGEAPDTINVPAPLHVTVGDLFSLPSTTALPGHTVRVVHLARVCHEGVGYVFEYEEA